MNKSGPINVIEDDADDQEILLEIFLRLDYKDKIVFFRDGNEALEYLDKTAKKMLFKHSKIVENRNRTIEIIENLIVNPMKKERSLFTT